MKKYKVYRQNILLNKIIKAKQLDLKPVKISAFLTFISGVSIVNLFKFFSIEESGIFLSCASIVLGVPLLILSTKNYECNRAKKRISELEKELLKKGIKVNILDASYFLSKNTLFLEGGGLIEYYDEDNIVYYDSENKNGLDISYDVNKNLMTKKEFRKYMKNIINNK